MTIARKFLCYVTVAAIATSCIFVPANVVLAKDKENAEVKFTARAELVLIPTLVTDKSGNHISGLKKEDFTVFENGVEQKLATFEEITTDPKRLSHPKNPNEFTNSLVGETSNRRITLIIQYQQATQADTKPPEGSGSKVKDGKPSPVMLPAATSKPADKPAPKAPEKK